MNSGPSVWLLRDLKVESRPFGHGESSFLDVYVSFVMICIPLRKVRWRHLPDDGIRALSERAFGRLSLADLA